MSDPNELRYNTALPEEALDEINRIQTRQRLNEFRNGKVVHETQYFADPFEAPAWRTQWVQQSA